MESAVVLAPAPALPTAAIARVLAGGLDLAVPEAARRTRYQLLHGAGVLVEGVTAEAADEIRRGLDAIGISSKVVTRDLLVAVQPAAMMPRGYRAIAMELGETGLQAARMITGRRVEIDPEEILALHLHALGDVPDSVDKLTTALAAVTTGLSPEAREEPAPAAVEGLELEETVVSERARLLARNLEDAGLEDLRFHLSLYCDAPIGPIRFRKDEFDFSCLGAKMGAHSLDNFLLLLEKLTSSLPPVWGCREAAAFLEDLEPLNLHHLREDEMANFERWIYRWGRLEKESET